MRGTFTVSKWFNFAFESPAALAILEATNWGRDRIGRCGGPFQGVPRAPRIALLHGGAAELNELNRCRVCQARFRGARICSRCGADLVRPMLLAAEAWCLRSNGHRGGGVRAWF